MSARRKALYTLNIDGYAPEICALTYPLLKHYATKIDADFVVITERRFPEWPVVYEKLQVGQLAREESREWAIYIDSDAVIHPETVDWTCFLPKDTVAHNGNDMANVRWRYDEYFRRDGRNIGSCNWYAIASEWCFDLWAPLDIPLEVALENIHPTVGEASSIITRDHLIDDYTLSRNIARFGLKFTTLVDLQQRIALPGANFHWHVYTVPVHEKVAAISKVIEDWKLERYVSDA